MSVDPSSRGWNDHKHLSDVAQWHTIGDAGEPAFLNGWTHYGGGFTPAAYCRLQSGLVALRGLIKSGTVGLDAFTLPPGFRIGVDPSATQYQHFAAPSAGAFGIITVSPGGSVNPAIGSNAWFDLSGIRYVVA